MKRNSATLVLGALLLAAMQPQPARAQPTLACFTDNYGFRWNLQLDLSTDTIIGSADTNDPDGLWFVMGGRGTNARTRSAHILSAVNGQLANDPSCSDGDGSVDFFTYDGLVTGSGFPYSYSGEWYNSCGGESTFSGAITLGPCFAPRHNTPPAGDTPATMTAPPAEADLRTSPGGYAVSSRPNPSNAGVTITYRIPEAAHVRLAVYDALGREVAVLVDEAREAGEHAVPWDAAALPAGTYLYRIEAGAYTEAKPIVLVR